MPKIIDRDARRQEIGAAAASLIARGGLEAATIRRVAAHSGYSKGIVEHFFQNKADLISAALSWANLCYESRAERATRGLDGLEALLARLRAALPVTDSIRDEWRVRLVYWSVAATDPQLCREHQARTQSSLASCERDIRAALRRGELEGTVDVTVLARQIRYLCSGICCAALHDPQLFSGTFLLQEMERSLDCLIGRA